MQFVIAGGIEGQKFSTQCWREGSAGAGPHAGGSARIIEVGQHAVDTVHGGARHQADEHRPRSHWLRPLLDVADLHLRGSAELRSHRLRGLVKQRLD